MQLIKTQISSPAYTVRRSKRARRISLRVHPGHGLEVVLPYHVGEDCIAEVLVRHHAWIEKALARTALKLPEHLCSSFAIKGNEECIELNLIGLGRRPGNLACAGCLIFSAGLSLQDDSALQEGRFRTITLTGMCSGQQEPIACLEVAKKRLRTWVKTEAEDYLKGLLEELAPLCKVEYKSLTVRFQRTRWGSCSSRGNINLNAALLFLPKALARYIVIHELCHLQHMNHSEKYWKEVFAVEPNALQYDKAMRSAWKYVPSWLML